MNILSCMNILFTGTVLTAFITTYMGSSLTVAIPTIESEFKVSGSTVGWMITVYMLASAIFSIIFGKMADTRGRMKFLFGGVALFTAASAAAVFSKSFWLLLCLRFLQGVGAAMIFSTNMAIAAEAAGRDNRGKAVGIITASNYAGMAAGPAAGGFLTGLFSWRGIFISAAVLGCFILLMLTGERRKESDTASNKGTGKNTGFQWKILLKNVSFCYAAFLTAINYGACYIVTYLFSSYLQDLQGFSSQAAGLILVAAPVVQALMSTWAGKLSDKYGTDKFILSGLALTGLSITAASFLMSESGLAVVVWLQLAIGAGAALFSASNINFALSKVEEEDYSMATAVMAAMRSVGHVAGIAVAGGVMRFYLGGGSMTAASANEIVGIVQTSFIIMGGLCIAGCAGRIILQRTKRL